MNKRCASLPYNWTKKEKVFVNNNKLSPRIIHMLIIGTKKYIIIVLTTLFCLMQGTHKRMVRFQKLTRNLFLTLHGHNVHRQQRQLSKFLMRYQQFASHDYCGAAGPVYKMAPQQKKAFCVLRFEVSRSVITVQR